MNDITRILQQLQQGEGVAAEELILPVYEELRRLAAVRMANECADHTLPPTALVHEAYLRLVGAGETSNWQTRGHFFGAAAEAMRRILIESARRKKADKHGGSLQRVDLGSVTVASALPPDDLFDLDFALTEFEAVHPDKAALVRLRFFGGLSEAEAAECLGISRPTASRHWTFARAWLLNRMKDSPQS